MSALDDRPENITDLPNPLENMGKPKRIKGVFRDFSGKEYYSAEKYKSGVVYAPIKVCNNRYARAIHAPTGKTIAKWTSKPINGKVKVVKDKIRRISELIDWNRFEELTSHQQHLLGKEVRKIAGEEVG